MSAVSVVELSSRFVRESCLNKIGEDNAIMTNANMGTIKIGRAKTNLQMNRNNILYRVEDFCKKGVSMKSKTVKIIWRMDDSKNKDRGVEIDGVMPFMQSNSDLSGKFLAPYQETNL